MSHRRVPVAELLAEVNAQATFFVVGQIVRTHPQLIRDMVLAGHEVGCHSWDHQLVHRHSVASLNREDVHRARATLEEAAGGAGNRLSCGPTFSITGETAWAIDVLADEGFRYDSSVFPVRHDRYGVPKCALNSLSRGGPRTIAVRIAARHVRNWLVESARGWRRIFSLFPPAIPARHSPTGARTDWPGGALLPPVGVRPLPAAIAAQEHEPITHLCRHSRQPGAVQTTFDPVSVVSINRCAGELATNRSCTEELSARPVGRPSEPNAL